ncbi:hypothetical protein JNO13_06240 [Pseudomonas sp. 1079]|nr:hypothetical protein [Pseudomonas sp. 1079]MBN1080376.1 hypothetical protein [Pseudomonas sp. 1079]
MNKKEPGKAANGAPGNSQARMLAQMNGHRVGQALGKEQFMALQLQK